jgi:hypothetical protein
MARILVGIQDRRCSVDDTWRTSKRCEGGQCVQARRVDEDVQVRDCAATELTFCAPAWRQFVEGVKDGEFDRKP